MKIISYNVNGIRSAESKGLSDWIRREDPDILCLQEIKVAREDFNEKPFKALGYHCYLFPAEKKGYSGTAIFSKAEADRIVEGCGHELYDREGRNIRADFGSVSVMSAYFPSGTTGDERQAVKMEYLDHIYDYLKELKKTRPKLVLAGDYNICHKAIDIHDPIRNKNVSGFKPEEREWMEKFFNSEYVDSFRRYHPEPDQYSWWSLRAGSRARNKGWRIDYIALSSNLEIALQDAALHPEAKHSDHCPASCILNDQKLNN